MSTRRLTYFSALALSLCLLCSCAPPTSSASPDPITVVNAVTEAAENLPEMTILTSQDERGEELFPYLSDLDYGKINGYYFAYAAAGTAEEIAVIRLANQDDVDEAMASLQRHVQHRVGMFENYSPEQVPTAKAAQILSHGSLVALIISPNYEAPVQSFRTYGMD